MKRPSWRRAAPEWPVTAETASRLDRAAMRNTGIRLSRDQAAWLAYLLSYIKELFDPRQTPEGQPAGDFRGDDALQRTVMYEENGRGDCVFCIGHQDKPPGAKMWRPLQHAPNCPWVTLLQHWGAVP